MPEAYELLRNAGIDFEKHAKQGVSYHVFRKCLFESGLIRNPKLTWIAFNAKFDFAYLLSILLGPN